MGNGNCDSCGAPTSGGYCEYCCCDQGDYSDWVKDKGTKKKEDPPKEDSLDKRIEKLLETLYDIYHDGGDRQSETTKRCLSEYETLTGKKKPGFWV